MGDGSKKEIFLLKIASYLTVVYAAVGIWIAIVCDSETMMLDGLYGAADVFVSVVAIFVVKKVYQPPNARYHYGYAKYEPFMTAVDGILIATICAASIMSSLQDLVNHDPVKNLSLAVWYSFASIFICTGFGVWMRRCGHRSGSRILVADSQLWIMEGVISLGVFVAFGTGLAMKGTRWAQYTDFADPILCIVISLVFMAKPLSILKESFLDLVDASPGPSMTQSIEADARVCCRDYGLSGVGSIKARRAGRIFFATVTLWAGKDQTLKDVEAIRPQITARLLDKRPGMDLSLIFATVAG